MKTITISFAQRVLMMSVLVSVWTNTVTASPICESLFQPSEAKVATMSAFEAGQVSWLDDTTTQIVRMDVRDIAMTQAVLPLALRPDFKLLLLRLSASETLLALVAERSRPPGAIDSTVDTENPLQARFLGQQVVQWQKIDAPYHRINQALTSDEGSFVTLSTSVKAFGGNDKIKSIKTKIFVAKQLAIESRSFEEISTYVQNNPRVENLNKKTLAAEMLRLLFGRVWTKIFGSRGEFNSLNASQKLLKEEKLIVEGKEKLLHVSGQIFTSELNVSSASSFSGHLAPGRYYVVGRLSSSLKNLDVQNEKGEVEPNSLAIAMLLFRTRDQKEQPGLLFLQDSLAPIQNVGLAKNQLSNNPAFAFRPTSIREFFEQGFAVLGVGLAAFKNKRDSARGVQGNYRSPYGATSNGVDLAAGQAMVAPRFVAVQFNGEANPLAPTHDASMQQIRATLTLRTSDDARNWTNIGLFSNINWLRVDSHELTFPHGLSGTIDPVTLRPATGMPGVGGLLLPTDAHLLP